MIFVIVLCGRHIQEPNFLFIDYKILEDSECKYSYSQFITKRKNEVDRVLRLQMVRSVCMKLYSSVCTLVSSANTYTENLKLQKSSYGFTSGQEY